VTKYPTSILQDFQLKRVQRIAFSFLHWENSLLECFSEIVIYNKLTLCNEGEGEKRDHKPDRQLVQWQ